MSMVYSTIEQCQHCCNLIPTPCHVDKFFRQALTLIELSLPLPVHLVLLALLESQTQLLQLRITFNYEALSSNPKLWVYGCLRQFFNGRMAIRNHMTIYGANHIARPYGLRMVRKPGLHNQLRYPTRHGMVLVEVEGNPVGQSVMPLFERRDHRPEHILQSVLTFLATSMSQKSGRWF